MIQEFEWKLDAECYLITKYHLYAETYLAVNNKMGSFPIPQ